MKLTSQQYAGLAEDAYKDYPVGVSPPGKRDPVVIEGIAYQVREHIDNPKTGYQGTVYQRVDTGDLVVAHRGTEQVWQDGVKADAGMVLGRANLQAPEAIALTRRATKLAEKAVDQRT